MPIIINPKSEEHWLQLKTEDISSTEISALFGISPYSTAFELWHEKKSGEIKRLSENNRMTWGKRLEDTIAAGIAEDINLKVRRLKTYQRHDAVKGFGASFDYEIVGDISKSDVMKTHPHLSGPGILEIKNVDFLIYRDQWEEDEAPPHIEAQLQHQLEVTGRSWGIIAALVAGNTMNYIVRERNEKVGAAMRRKVEKFWQSIEAGQPPEPDFKTDADFIISMYGESNQWIVDVSEDDNIKPLVEQFYDLSMQVKDVTDLKEAVKARILMEVQGNAKKITCGDISISCGVTKDTPPVVVTPDMVGTEICGRKGYRMFRAFKRKPVEKNKMPAKRTEEIKPTPTEDFVI